MTITVSTDGSALGNPNGPMGWAWADHEPAAGGKPGHEHDGDCDAGGATNGTNQIGELCAVLEALRAHPGSEPLTIETDSQYAINCSTTWVKGWKRNGWRNSQKKPVKNADVIRAIDEEIAKRPGPVKFVWVKGHAGNAGNEKVDDLARTYAGNCRSKVCEGYLPLEGWKSLLASEYSRGTDVPEDARMLLDGAITPAEYHMGRGQGASASQDEQRTMAVETQDDDRTTVIATHAPHESYAKMLIKHDYFPRDDASEDSGESSSRDDADNGGNAGKESAESIGNAGKQQPTETAHDDGSGSTAPVSADATANDPTTDAGASGGTAMDGDATADDGSTTDHSATGSVSGSGVTTGNTSTNSNMPSAEARAQLADLPKLPHRPSPSGLSVSGMVRFSPPPDSSPTFDGKPRLIRGYIAVEGYVLGDGTLVLDEAPFAVKHS